MPTAIQTPVSVRADVLDEGAPEEGTAEGGWAVQPDTASAMMTHPRNAWMTCGVRNVQLLTPSGRVANACDVGL